jgi:hypothetical protein
MTEKERMMASRQKTDTQLMTESERMTASQRMTERDLMTESQQTTESERMTANQDMTERECMTASEWMREAPQIMASEHMREREWMKPSQQIAESEWNRTRTQDCNTHSGGSGRRKCVNALKKRVTSNYDTPNRQICWINIQLISLFCCYVIRLKLNHIKSVMDECMRSMERIRLSWPRSCRNYMVSHFPGKISILSE